MKSLVSIVTALLLSSSVLASELSSPAPENARVYFITPEDGQTIESPFVTRFGLEGMGVAPAGVERENTGHHHLLIDTDIESLDISMPLPATDKVKHFGGGQTEEQQARPVVALGQLAVIRRTLLPGVREPRLDPAVDARSARTPPRPRRSGRGQDSRVGP